MHTTLIGETLNDWEVVDYDASASSRRVAVWILQCVVCGARDRISGQSINLSRIPACPGGHSGPPPGA